MGCERRSDPVFSPGRRKRGKPRWLWALRFLLVGLGGLACLSPGRGVHGASGYLKPAVSAKTLKKAEEYHSDGVELYRSRRYRAALRKFEAAEKVCPELFTAGYHVALTHQKLGNEDAGIAQLKKLNMRFPGNIIAHNDLGVIYASQDKEESDVLAHLEFGMAIRNGESLLKGKEKSVAQVRVDLAMAYANVGALQLKGSEFSDAEKSFRKAVEHYPHAFFGHFGLGNVLFAMRKFGEAKAAYRKAQEIEPRNPSVHMALARCYLLAADKNPRFALAELRKVRGNRPPPDLYDLLGDAHALLGNSEEAIKNYQRHLEASERKPGTLYKVGVVYYNNGNRPDAKTYLEEFVSKASESERESLSAARKLLGDIERERKEYEKAIGHYLKGAELRPVYFSCQYGLADCYFHLQQYDKAREYLLLLLDGLPENGNDRENSLREKASELLKKLPES